MNPLWNGLKSPLWNSTRQGVWFPLGGSPQAGGGGGSSPFDPLTLYSGGKKGVWIKPRDWSTLFQTSGGSVAVSAATDPVGYATDLSGNAEHFTQPTTGDRPLAITVSGVNAIDLNGTSSSMTSGTVVAGDWTTMDLFAVVYLDGFDTTGSLFGDDNGVNFLGIAQNGSASSAAINAGSPSYRINGVSVSGGTSVTRDQLYDALSTGGWLVVEANGLNLSAWTALRFSGYSGYRIDGKFAELILCESVSDAVRAQVRTYMGDAVGLTI